MVKFYFRFPFLLNFRHRHFILHWPTKLRQNRTTLGGVMTPYQFFSRWRTPTILDLIWIILDHPLSAIAGLRFVLKFSLDRIYSFGDIAIFIFSVWLEIAYSSPLGWGGLGAYFPEMTSSIVLTPKRHFLTRKHVVWAIQRKNRFCGSTQARSRKKDRTAQSNKVTFDYMGRSPHYTD